MNTTFITATPEQALRARAKSVWEAGDFGLIARHSEAAATEFIERLPLTPGQRVLDVACGTGNLALPAARLGAFVCGLDLAAKLLEQARVRAAAEGLAIEFTEGDAEALPYPAGRFDVVVSMFGVMFAPRPDRAAAELLRVCRPGGLVALANWTAEGFIADNFRLMARHVPPPPGSVSPLLWGDPVTVRARLGGDEVNVRFERRLARLAYPFPPAQTVDFFRQFYGPTLKAFAALDPDGQARLRADLESLFTSHNCDRNGGTVFEAEYLEVLLTRP